MFFRGYWQGNFVRSRPCSENKRWKEKRHANIMVLDNSGLRSLQQYAVSSSNPMVRSDTLLFYLLVLRLWRLCHPTLPKHLWNSRVSSCLAWFTHLFLLPENPGSRILPNFNDNSYTIHDDLRTMKRNAKQLIMKTVALKCGGNTFANNLNHRLTISDGYS